MSGRVEVQTTAETVGRRHLELASPTVRGGRGQVYTPGSLVDFVLRELTHPGGLLAGPTLDPACGCGAFLEGMTRLLATQLEDAGVCVIGGPGRHQFIQAVEATVFGVDIDAEAVARARNVVRTVAITISPGPLPPLWFSRNVAVADFLFDDVGSVLGFSEAPVSIVGNPPYVATTRLDPVHKQRLRLRFATAHGRLDLYTLFIERAAELLAPKGRLAFITPDKFLVSKSAAPLRAWLLERGALIRVSTFDEHDAFRGAATVPCVTVWQAGAPQRAVAVQQCATRGRDVVVGRTAELTPAHVSSGEWHPRATPEEPLLRRIVGSHRTLESCTSRVSAGLATGLNAAMVIRASEVPEGEEAIWRPALRGRDISAFRVSDSGLAVLLPYEMTPAPRLVDLRNYPKTLERLQAHRDALEQRHCVRVWGKAWFDLHDPVPGPVDTTPKLVVPDVARGNRFAFDPGAFWPLHSAYYLTPSGIDPVALMAILNSRAIECLLRARAPRVKDGFSRYRRQFLLDLPIPDVDERFVRAVRVAVDGGDLAQAIHLADRLFEIPDVELRDALARIEASSVGGHCNAS